MNALGIACGVIGGWIILAAMGATVPHRLKRAMQAADPGEDVTEIQRYLPPVPQRDDLMALVPADCLTDDDPELHGRFWGLVGAGWEI